MQFERRPDAPPPGPSAAADSDSNDTDTNSSNTSTTQTEEGSLIASMGPVANVWTSAGNCLDGMHFGMQLYKGGLYGEKNATQAAEVNSSHVRSIKCRQGEQFCDRTVRTFLPWTAGGGRGLPTAPHLLPPALTATSHPNRG